MAPWCPGGRRLVVANAEQVSGHDCDHCRVLRLNLSTSSPANSDLATCDLVFSWSFFAEVLVEWLLLLPLRLPDTLVQQRRKVTILWTEVVSKILRTFSLPHFPQKTPGVAVGTPYISNRRPTETLIFASLNEVVKL